MQPVIAWKAAEPVCVFMCVCVCMHMSVFNDHLLAEASGGASVVCKCLCPSQNTEQDRELAESSGCNIS